ncbi:MAG: hypothetical protein H7A24_15980 [Leptospiraceae bacterium]|nr:hypothetical protein [Leptospiraceae bacterium]MCP5513386.1 hypothetical protein [Leptospiraceae bacterium]
MDQKDYNQLLGTISQIYETSQEEGISGMKNFPNSSVRKEEPIPRPLRNRNPFPETR